MAIEIIGFSEDNTKVILERVDVTPVENAYYLNKSDNNLYKYETDTFNMITTLTITGYTEDQGDGIKIIINDVETDPVDGAIYLDISDHDAPKYVTYEDSNFSDIDYTSVDVIDENNVAYNSNVETDPVEGGTYINTTDNKIYTYNDGVFTRIIPTYIITGVSSDLTTVTIDGEEVSVENDSIYNYEEVGITFVGINDTLSVTEFNPIEIETTSVDIKSKRYDAHEVFPFVEIIGYEEDEENNITFLVENPDDEENPLTLEPVEGTLYKNIRTDEYFKYENGSLELTYDIDRYYTADAVNDVKYIMEDDPYRESHMFVTSVDTTNNIIKVANIDIPLDIFSNGVNTPSDCIVTVNVNEHYRVLHDDVEDVNRIEEYIVPYTDLPVDSINIENGTVIINGEEVPAVDYSTYVDSDGITYYYDYGNFSIAEKYEDTAGVSSDFTKILVEDPDTGETEEQTPILGIIYRSTNNGDDYIFVSGINYYRTEVNINNIRVTAAANYYIDTSTDYVYTYDGIYFNRYTDYDEKFDNVSYSYDNDTKELTIMIPRKVGTWHLPAAIGDTENIGIVTISDKISFGFNEFYEANTIIIKEADLILDDGEIDITSYV